MTRSQLVKTVCALVAAGFQLAICSHSEARHTRMPAPRHSVKRSSHRHPRRRAAIAHAAIIGGSEAEAGTFPWLAHIAYKNGEYAFYCTGTVVAPNVVLTAGHCAEDVEAGALDEPSGYAIVTGNVEWTASDRQVSGVSRVVVYPGFNRTYLAGDAALLVLSTPTTAPAIPLASYPSDSTILEAGTLGIIAGWGNTYSEQETPTERLRWAYTVLQSPSYCESKAAPFYEGEEFCAIDPPDLETGTCFGDSGGPLLAKNPSGSGDVELGVTSHLYGECNTSRPSVFTRADFIASWVAEWIAAVKPAPPPPAPSPPPSPSPSPPAKPTTTTAPTTSASNAPALPPIEGVYRGATSQANATIGVVVGSGGKQLTAIATTATYRCQSGHSFSEPLEGLSNGEPESITASHTFTVSFAEGANNETLSGSIDQAQGEITGTLTAKRRTRRYGPCSTGRVSWTAQRSAAAASTAALTSPGDYDGWTNQNDRITATVAPDGRQLSGLEFSARYACPRHHGVRLTKSFLTPSDTEAIEDFGTFTVHLGGYDYSGRVDGTFGLTLNSAFGTLEASTVTRYGHCHTGVIPWWA